MNEKNRVLQTSQIIARFSNEKAPLKTISTSKNILFHQVISKTTIRL